MQVVPDKVRKLEALHVLHSALLGPEHVKQVESHS